MRKYKPIRVHHTYYGYGWWWNEHLYFIGRRSTCFAIVPLCRECMQCIYAKNGHVVGHGYTRSWHISRQRQAMEE